MRDDGQELTKRIRIGFTGLATVFLLVMLGAIFVQFIRDGETSQVDERNAATAADEADNAAQPREPLAELGVAPGNLPPAPAPAQEGPAPAPSR